MMFAPQGSALETNLTRPATRPSRSGQTSNKHTSSGGTGTATPNINNHLHTGSRTPKPKAVRMLSRPNMAPRQNTAPNTFGIGSLSFLDANNRHSHRQPSFNARALDLASEIGDNKFNTLGGMGDGNGGGDDFSGMPASFSEAFLREREFARRREAEQKRSEEEEKGMVNRIMLARMNTLEEGFREVLKEIKTISSTAASAAGGVLSRHGSEGEVPVGVKARAKLERTDSRRSPRKVVRKGKTAEKERPGSGLREEEGVDDEVRSPVSVVGPGERVDVVEGGGSAQGGDEPVTPPEDAQRTE